MSFSIDIPFNKICIFKNIDMLCCNGNRDTLLTGNFRETVGKVDSYENTE
ncbi:hypothetical protein [Methanolobus psychrotolerans]|nr:hypothetical protein [Methanolobus psychrotolerans]